MEPLEDSMRPSDSATFLQHAQDCIRLLILGRLAQHIFLGPRLSTGNGIDELTLEAADVAR